MFETERLLVREWHASDLPEPIADNLPNIVASILTEPVTRALPEAWHGAFDVERAQAWIEERDAEGATLLVLETPNSKPVGLLILFETTLGEGVELRLGYLLAEAAWGKGFATEIVAGLVDWCRGQTGIRSLAGGVARDNPASKRVLEKNGFAVSDRFDEADAAEETLRLDLGPD